MRRILIATVFLILFQAYRILGEDSPETANRKNKPNIIVILSDDAGYADFGFQGSKDILTPNLDKLAKNGVVFTDAHVTATVCSPSRAGLLTGRYQQRFGHEANLIHEAEGMDPGERTIADALKAVGYRTSVFGKWHLGNTLKYHPNKRGFDEFYGMMAGSRSYFPSEEDDRPGKNKAIMRNSEYVKFDGYLTDVLGDRTVDFINENKDRPFFVYLSFNAVHTPLHAGKEALEKFKGHPRATLAAMTWSMDEAVGRVMAALEKNDIMENTIIFFTNDNGGAHNNQSSNAPLKGFKGNKFEGGHRVPFIVHWKGGIEGGKVYNEMVSSLDIFATAVTAAGGDLNAGKPLDGVDLLPYLTGVNKGIPHKVLFWRKEDMAAVRYDKWKLIRLENYGSVIYNLESDPGEEKNLAEKNPEQFVFLKNQLEEWEKGLIDPLWNESKAWRDVTWGVHKDYMENRKPVKLHP